MFSLSRLVRIAFLWLEKEVLDRGKIEKEKTL